MNRPRLKVWHLLGGLIARERTMRDAAKKNLEGFRPLFVDVGA